SAPQTMQGWPVIQPMSASRAVLGSKRDGKPRGRRDPAEQGGLQRVIEVRLALPGGAAGEVLRGQFVAPASQPVVEDVERRVIPEPLIPAVVGRVAGGRVQVGRGADGL